MLKPSHKKIQSTGIKKDGKIDAQEQLNFIVNHWSFTEAYSRLCQAFTM